MSKLTPTMKRLHGPEAETYEDVKRLIYKTVFQFQMKYGGEFSELISEGDLSYLKAIRSYQKEKSQFQTWLRLKVWDGLLELHRRRGIDATRFQATCMERMGLNQHITTDSSGEETPVTSPVDSLHVRIQDLSDDAIFTIHLAIEPEMESVLKTKEYYRYTGPTHKRRAIRRYLRQSMGWNVRKIDRVFQEVQEAL